MQTLLSEHWHAVRFLRPRLREGVQPLHRRLRGRPWVLLADPVTQRFHRVTPSVWRVLQLLDGTRDLDAVWDAACEQVNPEGGADQAAISQHELVQLLSSLYANDLLQTQVAPDAAEVFDRYKRQTRAKLKQSWLNPMSLKLPLLYPDAWFERHAGMARALFSWGMAALWLLIVTPAAVLAAQHWSALTENLSDRVLSASNVALLWFTYPLVKAVHEWAHGMAVKAWGGTVREIGLMFVVFTPVPYVDASSSYRFPSKWARAAVAAAGILAELLLGALAVYVWLLSESGLVSAIAFNVLLITGVSTVVVNGNPLMRYDGYFIFCDLLEVPNLAQRATQYWAYLIDRHAFNSPDAQPPVESTGERWLLALYGAVAPFYRLSVSIGLVLFIASEYLILGVVMALFGAWTAFVMPLWKGWKHLRESPGLARRRELALRRTLTALALLVVGVALLPLPFYSVHQAVVWLPDEAIVRAEAPGQVSAAPVKAGQRVEARQALMSLDSLDLQAEHAVADSTVQRAAAQLRKAEVDDPVKAQALRAELAMQQARLDEMQRRVESLNVRAQAAGRWTPAAPTELVGRHVRRGEVLGYVVAGPSRLVRTAVTQEDMDLIRSRVQGVDVRFAHAMRTSVAGTVRRQVPGGATDLVSPALGTTGGGEIAVDPAEQGGTRSLARVFDVEVLLERHSSTAVFGDRAYVRFDLGWAPLGWQWALRLRQLFLARLNV
ncbi:site-2 protease family protein [Caldimonas brevitalea]|uniref:Putative peptide zinc metalloprotease protein n=1 Tax=Caldimonas brevitalea TaxID=413882 RepID=A0A0G3BU92_9BURK|nr:site-2 protease family protein [Caldimonas brevitalea]AKJ30100.1 putative peptide zinc metalloprotease protein [Caldimonas brevitalea]